MTAGLKVDAVARKCARDAQIPRMVPSTKILDRGGCTTQKETTFKYIASKISPARLPRGTVVGGAYAYLAEQHMGHGGAAHRRAGVARHGLLHDVGGQHSYSVDCLIQGAKIKSEGRQEIGGLEWRGGMSEPKCAGANKETNSILM